MQSIRGYACIDATNDVKVYSVDMRKLCDDDVSKRSACKSCLFAV